MRKNPTLGEVLQELGLGDTPDDRALSVCYRFGGVPTEPLSAACADSIRAELSPRPWESELSGVSDKVTAAAAAGVLVSDIDNARRTLIRKGCRWRKMKRRYRGQVSIVQYFDAKDLAILVQHFRSMAQRRERQAAGGGRLPPPAADAGLQPGVVDKIRQQARTNNGRLTVAWVVRNCALPHEAAWQVLKTMGVMA